MMKDAIVLYPSLGKGHLAAMVELGKLILTHYPSFSITILILTPPNTFQHLNPNIAGETTDKYIAAVSATIPSITFHHLPAAPFPSTLPRRFLGFQLPLLSNPDVHHALKTISQTSKLQAFVMDFFNYAAADVAASLNIPSYYYFTSGASALAVILHLPTMDQAITINLKDFNILPEIPGLPPVSASDVPEFMERGTKMYEAFLILGTHMRKSDGIIVNTFEEIEMRAVKEFTDEQSALEGPKPPLFCIGPLISTQQGEGDKDGCLSWLNKQPNQRVVLLSFGSMGKFSVAQLKEMAIGLERSGQRFLWVVRNPPPSESESATVNSEVDLEALLPEGFCERTKDRGLVVKNWAPQVAILSHESVGGFVTHCGWNSVLEAICAGVPMVTWPLYAEQKLNRVLLVKEMKVALAMNESEEGFVSATELQDRITELMDSEKGKEIRERILGVRNSAMAAPQEGGSSRVGLNRFIESCKHI